MYNACDDEDTSIIQVNETAVVVQLTAHSTTVKGLNPAVA
jgi:hypothetical protein